MTNREPFVDKYRPETLDDIQGNNSDLDTIEYWADHWNVGDQPVLLIGPPGTGKTSTAEAVANRLGVQTVEVNASSARSTEDLQRMSNLIRSTGEDGMRLVIVDEVDSWHHAPKKQSLYDALDHPANPVVMTANDEYETPEGIKNRADVFDFSLGKRSRKAKLKAIIEAENLDLEPSEIDDLAERPDLRSAINDLQLVAQGAEVGEDEREWETDEFDMLDDVLTGTADIGSLKPESAMMYIDECLSAEYRELEMAMGYECLSLADQRLAAAREKGYYHWRYARALVEEVAHIRQTEPYYGDEISYKNKSFPTWFRHSKPKATGGSAKAKLYRALKGVDETGMEFSGDFVMFIQTYLPILKDLDQEEKFELIMHYRLDPEQYEVLGVSESEFDDWMEVEAPETGEWGGKTQSADEW